MGFKDRNSGNGWNVAACIIFPRLRSIFVTVHLTASESVDLGLRTPLRRFCPSCRGLHGSRRGAGEGQGVTRFASPECRGRVFGRGARHKGAAPQGSLDFGYLDEQHLRQSTSRFCRETSCCSRLECLPLAG